MKAVCRFFFTFIMSYFYRTKGVKFSPFTYLNLRTKFEGDNVIGKKTVISNSRIGKGSYIGQNSNLANCEIGRFCSIASDVSIIVGTHPTNFVSTSPAFFSLRKQNGKTYVDRQLFEEIQARTIIGNDVWIGEDVRIMGGVKIGNGAIVGARALVVKDVPPYAIVGGVPAKIIRYRFNESIIKELQLLQWWNRPEEWLQKNAKYFVDVELLLARLRNIR